MKDSFNEINVIPLVDIMLVLITIVLVTANFLERGIIPVNLPKANAENPSMNKTIVLDMTSNGTLFLEGKKVSLQTLPSKLADKDKNTPILISADKKANIQPFVSTVEVLKNGGFYKISIQTEK